jgi:TetR/AcrR family transcriptional regulator
MSPTLRKPTADRRLEIAQAVFRIIGERGLTTLTTATIAAEVGVTSGALYRHFASLDEILVETVRQGVARIESTFPDPALRPIERLLGLARSRVRLLADDPGLVWLLRSEQAYLALPPDAVGLLRGIARRSRAFVLKSLRDGATDGSVRNDIEPDLLLVPVVATIHAVIGRSAAPRGRSRYAQPDPERVLLALARLLEPPDAAPSAGSRSPRSKTRRTTKKEIAR